MAVKRANGRGTVWLVAGALATLTAGCPSDESPDGGKGGEQGDGSVDGGKGDGGKGDGGPGPSVADASGDRNVFSDVPLGCTAGATTALDLLFVIDDSNSMALEQEALRRELPRMVRVLASGDLDGDGDEDFPPLQNMHLGVVSTNMGAPVNLLGESLPPTPSGLSCVSPGQDGLLQFADTCEGKSPNGNYLEFHEGDDPEVLAESFDCAADLGVAGCGFEQQLDAMLKALTADEDITFYEGSTGHGGPADGDGANAGFVRENALLAVILVTDEDDCSIPDANASLFSFATSGTATLTNTTTGDPIEQQLATPLNLRCGTYPDALHPISRYVDGLLGLKPGHPERVVFGAITGIPVALEGDAPADILKDPSMEFRSNMPDMPGSPQSLPEPSCERDHDDDPASELQVAFPPRRIVELAGELGDQAVVRSICQNDFSGALGAILERISAAVTCVELF